MCKYLNVSNLEYTTTFNTYNITFTTYTYYYIYPHIIHLFTDILDGSGVYKLHLSQHIMRLIFGDIYDMLYR